MKRPKMIIFDYGQTLVAEAEFDGAKGAAAVMAHAVSNPMSLTPEDVQAEANKINKELNRFDRNSRAQNAVEIPNHMFTRYLYDSLGIKIDLTAEEIDRLFWDNASPGRPTNGMPDLLEWLCQNGIRTAVLSNISYAGSIVEERINRLLPDNHFEFIIATSEFLFRKPHARIFELALGKAGLPADDVWYIGDNYACDIVGARTAGLFPVLFTGASDYEQPEHDDVISIASWTELKELISDIQK